MKQGNIENLVQCQNVTKTIKLQLLLLGNSVAVYIHSFEYEL